MKQRGRQRQGAPLLSEVARPAAKVARRLRVERGIREELSRALRKLQDPRLATAGVTRVEVSEDLKHARVYVRLTFGDDGPEARAGMLQGIQRAAGRLRSHIGATLKLRHTPALRFVYDEGPDAARRVDDLLAEIRAEAEPED